MNFHIIVIFGLLVLNVNGGEANHFLMTNNSVIESVGQLHLGWSYSALDRLLTAVARRTLHELPQPLQDQFEYCFMSKNANDVQGKSICLVDAFDKRTSSRRTLLQQFRKLWARRLRSKGTTPIVRRSKRSTVQSVLRQPLRPYSSYLTASGVDALPTPSMRHEYSLLSPQHEFNLVTALHSLLKGQLPNTRIQQADSRRNYHVWQRLNRIMQLVNKQPPATRTRFNQQQHSDPTQISENSTIGHSLLSVIDSFAKVAQQNNLSSLALLSPRFLSISANDDNVDKLLSPEILSFRREHPGSLPQIMDAFNMQNKDEWLQTLMQLTGANDAVAKVFDWIDHEVDNSTSAERHQLAMAHLRLLETWATYMDSFSKRQIKDMDKYGYTFMENHQLDIFFNNHSPYNKADRELFVELRNRQGKKKALEDEIRRLARGGANDRGSSTHRRYKRAPTRIKGVLTPHLFSPSILSPHALGISVLSPSIFSPGILAPGALTVGVLSPSMFNPKVLSPGVLQPGILSPTMFSPAILSPGVLNPAILSPHMFSPAILSPKVLTPDILGPTLLSGAVLSPAVLSPGVLAPGLLNAGVLSPKVLS